MKVRESLVTVAMAAVVGPAMGQAINIDFGLPGAGPSDTYGGAGLAGVWNSIEAKHTPFTNPQFVYDLVGLDGEPTNVTLYQFGGTELALDADPSIDGDDATLLGDRLITHTQNLESCLWINGLENGTYEVITYAWMPNSPDARARVRMDFTPNLEVVGGAWPGQHVEGVTFARHFVEVTNGFIGAHSGNVQGGNLVVGAAMNGIQLRPLADCAVPRIENGQANASFETAAFDGYVDPRSESTNGIDVDLGLSQITIGFNTPVRDSGGAELTAASFSATQSGGGVAPEVVGIETEDNTVVTLLLDRPISILAWTTLHTDVVSECSGESVAGPNSVRVGFLPGDVDQNGTVQPFDLLRFRQIVTGEFIPANGIVADYVDIDRDGNTLPFDLLRFRQLINGVAPATQMWADASLP